MKKQNKMLSYIKAKGFYIALAVCIVGASASAWTLANRTLETIDGRNGQISGQSANGGDGQWQNNSLQEFSEVPTQNSQEDIKKPSPASSSVSAPESSAGSVMKPVEPSEPPVPLPVQQTVSFQWPLSSGEVLTQFSKGELVKNKTLNVWRTHDSIDIAGEKGAQVVAIADATVIAISNDALWGGMIQLEHPDGHVTVYCGVVFAKDLKAGQQVKAGAPIGTVGQIPAEISMASHIHLTISKDGKAVDPMSLLKNPTAAK